MVGAADHAHDAFVPPVLWDDLFLHESKAFVERRQRFTERPEV